MLLSDRLNSAMIVGTLAVKSLDTILRIIDQTFPLSKIKIFLPFAKLTFLFYDTLAPYLTSILLIL